jgi:hypothetical protein
MEHHMKITFPENEDKLLQDLPTPGDGPSCFDLACDIIGLVSGPEDLSTIPEHLDGFGQ